MAAKRAYAVVAGAGPGTGAALAHKFAESYPVVLLARREESYNALVADIKSKGGIARGIPTDLSSAESVQGAFRSIDEEFGEITYCAAAIFHAGAKLARKPFLELTEAEFTNPYDVGCKGGFYFSQAVLPRLLKGVDQAPTRPPTLLFTGATASLKSSALFSSFATAKFATRALSQSLAREFGPKGIHVGHVIIDGVIDLAGSKEYLKDAGPDAKISPASIADTYWYLHTQPRSAFSHELEVRPWVEKW